MALDHSSQINDTSRKTVLLVFPGDRGHFASCIPLAIELKKLKLNVELWTHSVTKKWYKEGIFDTVNESLGSGEELLEFVKLYKQSCSLGDGDNKSMEAMFENFPKLLAKTDLSFEKMSEYSVTNAGKEAFIKRLKTNHPAIVVWEATWCKWVADICTENGIRCFGIVPSPYHILRCHFSKSTNTELLDWDGKLAVRDIQKDPDPVSTTHPYGHVVSKILIQDATIRQNATLLGPFLPSPIDTVDKDDVGDDKLNQWLKLDDRGVVVISLGSQSALSIIGDNSGLILVQGALDAGVRVLFTGDKVIIPVSDADESADSIYCASYIPQWRVLNHKNVRVFITHCGANSAHEGLYAEVAMVPLPFFDDQYYIAENLEKTYGYNQNSNYSPLRKTDLRLPQNCSEHDIYQHNVKTRKKISMAIKMALNVNRTKLRELSKAIDSEKGVERAGDVILKIIDPK